MPHLVPPPEITLKQNVLRRSIEDGTKEIARLQKDIAMWKEELRGIEITLTSVYGTPSVKQESPPAAKPIIPRVLAQHLPKPRITIEKYEEMIVPFLRVRGTAKFMDIQAHVSSILGYPATTDMIGTAMEKLASISTVPPAPNKSHSGSQEKAIRSGLSPNHGMGVGSSLRRACSRNGLCARLSRVSSTCSGSIVTVAETSKRLWKSFLAWA
jgi:hypothetical protein